MITEILEYFGLKSGNSKKFDFVFVAGDDQTDEVMFTTLHEFQVSQIILVNDTNDSWLGKCNTRV